MALPLSPSHEARQPGQPDLEPHSLAALEPGAEAVIVGVSTDGVLGDRLLDLGFIPNSRVRVVRRAPLGDPVEYELRGYRVCLRHTEARVIQVRKVREE